MCLYLKGIYDAIIEPHIPSVCYFLLYLISLDGFLLLSCHKGNVHSLLLFSHAATTHTHTLHISYIFKQQINDSFISCIKYEYERIYEYGLIPKGHYKENIQQQQKAHIPVLISQI